MKQKGLMKAYLRVRAGQVLQDQPGLLEMFTGRHVQVCWLECRAVLLQIRHFLDGTHTDMQGSQSVEGLVVTSVNTVLIISSHLHHCEHSGKPQGCHCERCHWLNNTVHEGDTIQSHALWCSPGTCDQDKWLEGGRMEGRVRYLRGRSARIWGSVPWTVCSAQVGAWPRCWRVQSDARSGPARCPART